MSLKKNNKQIKTKQNQTKQKKIIRYKNFG